MATMVTQETPANYIRFAAANVHEIVAQKYHEQLTTLLHSSGENAGSIFTDFRHAADRNQSLRASFYSALKSSFEDLHHGLGNHPQRWNGLMKAIAEASLTDSTVNKHGNPP